MQIVEGYFARGSAPVGFMLGALRQVPLTMLMLKYACHARTSTTFSIRADLSTKRETRPVVTHSIIHTKYEIANTVKGFGRQNIPWKGEPLIF